MPRAEARVRELLFPRSKSAVGGQGGGRRGSKVFSARPLPSFRASLTPENRETTFAGPAPNAPPPTPFFFPPHSLPGPHLPAPARTYAGPFCSLSGRCAFLALGFSRLGSARLGRAPRGSAPLRSAPLASAPFGWAPLHSASSWLGSAPLGSTRLGSASGRAG